MLLHYGKKEKFIRQAIAACGLRAKPDTIAEKAVKYAWNALQLHCNDLINHFTNNGQDDYKKYWTLLKNASISRSKEKLLQNAANCNHADYSQFIVKSVTSFLKDIGSYNSAKINRIRKKMQKERNQVFDLRTHKDVPGRDMYEPLAA